MSPGLEHEYDDESWARFKAEAAARWPELTEAELEAARNDEELLITLLVRRYGMDRAAAVGQLTDAQGAVLE
jgi:hypothetical protein